MPSTASPLILQDPGYLFWAPLLTAEPTNTVAGSKFTDAWPGAWISLGATEDGSEFNYETKVEAVFVAEFFDAIKYSTTERSGSFSFNLADWQMNNVKRCMNGGTLATVSGSGATLLSSFIPPAPGSEVRAMLGWESLDSTVRLIVYQCINSGGLKSSFKKAPSIATMAAEFQFEIPTSQVFPWKLYTAGTGRVGT